MEGYRRPPGGLSEDFRRACEGISRGAHKGLAESYRKSPAGITS